MFAEAILALPPDEYWLFTVVSMAATGGGLFFGFQGIRRARLIEDVPTARIRSAHQGYVELNGRAEMMDGEPVLAPLTRHPCCWWRYRIEKQGEKNKWRVIRHERSDSLFLIRDETGRCVIDPDGAEVIPLHKRTWYGDSEYPSLPGDLPDSRANRGIRIGPIHLQNSFGQRYRYTEELMLGEDSLYAIGWFRTLDDVDHNRSRGELTRALLREWKQHPETLKARFDHDRNGVIDLQEWEEAREVAAERAAEEYAGQLASQHPHLLRQPPDGRLFLLSGLSEQTLVGRYRWRTIGGLATFFVAGAVATTLLSVRLL